MFVDIFVLKVLNRRNLIKKFEAWKVAKFDNFKKFQYRHERISRKLTKRIGYNLEYIFIGI